MLQTVDSPIVLSGIGEGLRFDLALPFSWRLFYFSAVAISVAGIIYTLACPVLIRNFSTFREFESEGRGLDYLKTYAEHLRNFAFEENAERLVTDPHVPVDIGKAWIAEVFWQIYNHENYKHRLWRTLCFGLYLFGLALIGIVLVQNFLYVVKLVLNNAPG